MGFHKTASTSFQQTLKASCNILSQNNLEPIRFSRVNVNSGKFNIGRQDHYNNSQPMGTLFMNSPQKFQMNNAIGLYTSNHIKCCQEIYSAELARFLSGGSDILISGEAISLFKRNEIESLCSFIREKKFEIIPFTLVRSPYQCICSGIQENVKGGTFCNLIRVNKSNLDLDNIKVPTKSQTVKKLLKIFGDSMNFFSFSEACKHPNGPVGFILEFMGIRNQNSINFVNSNESKSNEWTRFQNHINLIVPKFIDNTINPQFYCINDIWTDKSKFLLTEDEFKIIDKLIHNENETLHSLLHNRNFCDARFMYTDNIDAEEVMNKLLMLMNPH